MLKPLFAFPLVTSLVAVINIQVSSSGGNASSPDIYNLMFQDRIHSDDGVIYVELIQTRAFQSSTPFPPTLIPWELVGSAISQLSTATPVSTTLLTSIQVSSWSSAKGAKIGLANPGCWGIDVKAQKHTGVSGQGGVYGGDFTLELQCNISDDVFASLDIHSIEERGGGLGRAYFHCRTHGRGCQFQFHVCQWL
ncbi:hypothetical protein BJ875DRAFT_132258 [Amylocarpus encephaloides]|uniref:Uncharacterized protein n=1 Tax=Amylocarpus encephaloides TaxID=45428 RepID=A0A9P8CA18_9HELO|nr:hypothetical protein BJ875DRAFT_132258 [Amylocarpus encephaloides]